MQKEKFKIINKLENHKRLPKTINQFSGPPGKIKKKDSIVKNENKMIQ